MGHILKLLCEKIFGRGETVDWYWFVDSWFGAIYKEDKLMRTLNGAFILHNIYDTFSYLKYGLAAALCAALALMI